MIAFVALPSRLEPFFLDHGQRLSQRTDESGGDGVVVLSSNPIVLEQLQVEVKASTFDPAGKRTGAEHHGRETGWRAQAFLGAAETCVNAKLANLERHAAERGHCVDEYQRIVLTRDRGELGDGVENTGRGFGLDQRDDVGGSGAKRTP